MFKDPIKLTGKVKIILSGPSGYIKETREIDNLVVSVGKTYVASRIIENTTDIMSHIAIGTNNIKQTVSDTTLAAEIARVAFTSVITNDRTMIYVSSYDPGVGTGVISEAGIFNAASDGVMFARTSFSNVNKAAEDLLTITWAITVN